MSQDNKYNGWSNWETWNCNLHFDGSFEDEARTMSVDDLENYISEMVNESMPELDGLASDFLIASVQAINFREIAQLLHDDYFEETCNICEEFESNCECVQCSKCSAIVEFIDCIEQYHCNDCCKCEDED